MVRFITSMAFALLTANAALASDVQSDSLPPCVDKDCHLVATTITLPEATATTDLKIRMGSLIVEIPSRVTRIDIAKTATVFRYETSPPVVVSAETEKTVPFLESQSQPISLSDALQMIFNGTAKDQGIVEKYESSLLNRLMWVKKELLGNSGEAYVYHLGSIRIYYAPNSDGPYKNLAWAIESKYPDTAIRLESNCLRNDFLKILFSIRLIQEKEK